MVEASTFHLSVLASHANAFKLNRIVLRNVDSNFHAQEIENRKLLCRFIKNCGENLEALHIVDCKFEKDSFLEAVAENCPNFSELKLGRSHQNNFQVKMSSLFKIAENCPKFPSKLYIVECDELFDELKEDFSQVSEFTKKYYNRLKKIKVSSLLISLSQFARIEHCDANKLESVDIWCEPLNCKDAFLKKLAECKKLRKIKLNSEFLGAQKRENGDLEIKCNSLQILTLNNSDAFRKFFLYLPQLTVFTNEEECVKKNKLEYKVFAEKLKKKVVFVDSMVSVDQISRWKPQKLILDHKSFDHNILNRFFLVSYSFCSYSLQILFFYCENKCK